MKIVLMTETVSNENIVGILDIKKKKRRHVGIGMGVHMIGSQDHFLADLLKVVVDLMVDPMHIQRLLLCMRQCLLLQLCQR